MKFSVLTAVLFLITTPLSALADCNSRDFTVVYVNGILTTKPDALNDAEVLQSKIGTQFRNQSIVVRLGYNPSHLLGFDDLLTSIGEVYLGKSNLYVNGSDLDTILREIQPDVHTQKILLVGHSQGTFYTNAMYQYLLSHGIPQGDVAVYNIATPASYVSGNGKYLNSSSDELIGTVRALADEFHAPEPLPANIDLPPQVDPPGSFTGHALQADYLAGASDRIVGDMNTELGWLSSTARSKAQTGCFDAPPATAEDLAMNALYGVGDPASSGTSLIVSTEVHIAMQIGANTFALAQATYKVVTGTFSNLATTIDSILALNPERQMAAPGSSAGPLISDVKATSTEIATDMIPFINSAPKTNIPPIQSEPQVSPDIVVAMSSSSDELASTSASVQASSTPASALPSFIVAAPGVPLPYPNAGGTPELAPEPAITDTNTNTVSTSSVPLTAPILSIPDCAQSLAASPSCLLLDGNIELQWSAVSGAAAYEVDRSGIAIASTTATSTILSLDDQTSTAFTVAAINAHGAASTSASVALEINSQPALFNGSGTDASSSEPWIDLQNETDLTIDLSKLALVTANATSTLSGTLDSAADVQIAAPFWDGAAEIKLVTLDGATLDVLSPGGGGSGPSLQ